MHERHKMHNVTIAGHGFFEWVGVSFEILDRRGHFFPGMGGSLTK